MSAVLYLQEHTAHKDKFKVMMSDGVLAILIVIMVAPIVGLCTAGSIHDPYIRSTIDTLFTSGDTLVVSTEEFCYCNYQVQWIASIVAYETTFIVLLVISAFSNTTGLIQWNSRRKAY